LFTMASITIRNLDDATKVRLRVQAAHHSRSMEDEARHILRSALAESAAPQRNLAESVRLRFRPLGGVDIRLPARKSIRKPPKPDK
jgi:antitoxin FitA